MVVDRNDEVGDGLGSYGIVVEMLLNRRNKGRWDAGSKGPVLWHASDRAFAQPTHPNVPRTAVPSALSSGHRHHHRNPITLHRLL